MKVETKEITFFNDYHLDPSYEDKVRKKKIKVDLNNRKQLFDVIKRRREYKLWQPDGRERQKLLRALEDMNIKEDEMRKQRIHDAQKTDI